MESVDDGMSVLFDFHRINFLCAASHLKFQPQRKLKFG